MRRPLFGVLTVVGALLALALLTAPVSAQSGKLTGIVTDNQTGQPLSGVQVYLEGSGRGSLTQENGRYFIINVPAGTHTLVAELIGYATMRRENVTVSIDVTRQIDFAMPPEAVALGEVVVEAERTPLIPENQTGSVDMISRDEIDALPVTDIIGVLELEQGFLQVPQDNTTVVSFAQQRQGVTALRIRGGRGAETTVMIDNVPINNFVLGGPAFDITNKAIEQVAVFKGQMDAQYGNALSAVINYATPEGGRDFEGELEYRSSATGAWLGNDYDDTVDFDLLEGSVSGPIPGTDDKVRFFLAGRQRYGADRALEFDDDVFDPRSPSTEFNTPHQNDVIAGWRAVGFDEQRDIYAKATWFVTPAAKLNVSFIGYERETKPFDFDWMLSVNALDVAQSQQDSAFYIARQGLLDYQFLTQNSLRQERNMVIAKWDHTIGRTAYKVTGARLSQERVTCNFFAGVCLQNRFEDPNFSGGFVAPGPQPFQNSPTSGNDAFWGGEDLTTWTARADLESQVSDHHNISAGAFFQYHDLLFDEWANVGTNDVVRIRELYEANPWDGAFYIQDQIEYDFLTIKLGARFDYGKATGDFLANPVDPTNGTNALDVCSNPGEWQGVSLREVFVTETGEGLLNGTFDPSIHGVREVTVSADPTWTLQSCGDPLTRAQAARVASSDDFSEADARTQFSPRIGVSFPVTESANLFFNFGRYSQNPILRNNYRQTGIGTPTEGTTFGPGIFASSSVGVQFLGNPHLFTEEATTYEVGYTQLVGDTYAFSAVLFSKDQAGLTGITSVGAPPFVVNDPGGTYGTSTPSYAILTNQDFSTTRGIELSLRRRLQNYWGFDVNYGFSKCTSNAADPEREFEALFSEADPAIRDEIRCEIDRPHTFNGVLSFGVRNDVPDIPFGQFLQNTNLSLVLRAVSGLPYTPTNAFGGFGSTQQFERFSGTAPAQISVDLQARKDWTINNIRYGFFVNVVNLTDRANCIQVFETTGECTGGGEDQSRRRAGNTVGTNTASTFFDRPQFLGQRRSVTAGLRVRF